MSEEKQPIWRTALQDETHPLYRAAWMIFSPSMKVKRVAPRLEDQKDEVTRLLVSVLGSRELAWIISPGGGEAPINALNLAVHWQVGATLPYFFSIITDEEQLENISVLWDRAISGVRHFGPVVVEPLLALAKTHPDLYGSLINAAAVANPEDSRVYELAKARLQWWEHEKTIDGFEVEMMADAMLTCNLDEALPYLKGLIESRRTSGDLKGVLTSIVAFHERPKDE